MPVGRERNADPRWLVPLICRRSYPTKRDIGAIRIGARETRFEIASRAADRFTAAIAKPADRENDVRIELLRPEHAAAVPERTGAIVERDPRRTPPRDGRGPVRRARAPGADGPAQALRPGRRARPLYRPRSASRWGGRTRNGRRPPRSILIQPKEASNEEPLRSASGSAEPTAGPGAARGMWAAEMHRQQTAMLNEMTKQMVRFWTGGWMLPGGQGANSGRAVVAVGGSVARPGHGPERHVVHDMLRDGRLQEAVP